VEHNILYYCVDIHKIVELVLVALKRTGIANFSFERPFGVEVIRAAGYPG